MQSKRVLLPHGAAVAAAGGDGDPPPPSDCCTPPKVAPFCPAASSLVTPTVRGLGVGDRYYSILRPPRLAGNAPPASSCSSSSCPIPSAPPSIPEVIPCHAPLVADLIKMCAFPLPELVFRGWGVPVKGWKAWVEDMAGNDKFVMVWRAAGIEDAILNSTVSVQRMNNTMLALVGFWCCSTCTFVLPWGEVGFTLEDAHILGNLPVWGSPLQRILTDEEERLRLRLVQVREMLLNMQRKSGLKVRVTHHSWLSWFVDLEGDDELRHLGFIAYWLSKCVVASKPLHEVPSAVFGIAARLSKGERIALAPAVTANVYSDLTMITKTLQDCQGRIEPVRIEVWAQFRLLQAWLWERFHCLRPKQPVDLISQRSRVRISRWDKKVRRMSYHEALEALYYSRHFTWRPYTDELVNWVKPQWYTVVEQSLSVDECSPIWVYDALAIVSAAGLVGLTTEETIPMGQYKPYRVSMQLGYDQVIPMSTDQLVTPWDSSTICPTGIEFYIPSVTRECSTLRGYDEWWDDNARNLAASGIDLVKKMRKKRKVNDEKIENNEKDNSRDVSEDGNMKKNRLRGHVKVENESLSEQEEPNSVEKPANCCGDPHKKVVDDDPFNLIVIDSEEEEDMKHNDPENARQPDEGAVNELGFDDVLVDELEEFLSSGLQAELMSNGASPSSNGNSEKSAEHDGKRATYATIIGGIAEEMIRKYPKFFDMIPQCPHYLGLLRMNVDVGMKRMVYTSLWCRLVELMKRAIKTTCQTNVCEIQQLTEEARYLEKLGFDVRHLIARLKQPEKRLKRLELAKMALERVRERVKMAENHSSANISRAHISNLWKAVKDAEMNVLEREWEVEILGKCLNLK